MGNKTQRGYLILADISGYTRFMAGTELEHSQAILGDFLDLIIGQASGFTSLSVFDVLGKKVATLVNENLNAGRYEATFDAFRHVGISSGVYFYKLQAGSFSSTKKMILAK